MASLSWVILDELTASTIAPARALRWSHGILSAVLHGTTATATTATTTTMTDYECDGGGAPILRGRWLFRFLIAANAAVTALRLFPGHSHRLVDPQPDDGSDSDHRLAVLGLALANGLTLALRLALQWDHRHSQHALRELSDAKYRHKAL